MCFILLHLKEICETTGMFRKGTLSGANRFEQKGRGALNAPLFHTL